MKTYYSNDVLLHFDTLEDMRDTVDSSMRP